MSDNVGFNLAALESRHEAAEIRSELDWERKSNRFANALKSPVIYYKIENPTVETAERITKAFEAALGAVQVIYDATLESDWDWKFTGVSERARWIVEKLCEEVICKGMAAEVSEDFVNDFVGGWE